MGINSRYNSMGLAHKYLSMSEDTGIMWLHSIPSYEIPSRKVLDKALTAVTEFGDKARTRVFATWVEQVSAPSSPAISIAAPNPNYSPEQKFMVIRVSKERDMTTHLADRQILDETTGVENAERMAILTGDMTYLVEIKAQFTRKQTAVCEAFPSK